MAYHEVYLHPSLRLRPLQLSDADAVAQVIYAMCVTEGDPIVAVSVDELKHEWQKPDFNMEKDAFVVQTSEGRIAGYAVVINYHEYAILEMNGNVHPDFKGRGIGTTLLRAVEKRAREIMELAEPDIRVFI